MYTHTFMHTYMWLLPFLIASMTHCSSLCFQKKKMHFGSWLKRLLCKELSIRQMMGKKLPLILVLLIVLTLAHFAFKKLFFILFFVHSQIKLYIFIANNMKIRSIYTLRNDSIYLINIRITSQLSFLWGEHMTSNLLPFFKNKIYCQL